MTESTTARTCNQCGSPIDAMQLGGLCPKCLLLAGMQAEQSPDLQIRCPNCQITIEVVDDLSVKDVTCPSCDSRFSLVGDQAATVLEKQSGMISRFELIDRVGIGAFGTVWKARDPQIDRLVAIKIPRKEQLTPAEAEQFFREAQAAGQLNHPGIVSVHEVGREGDRIYMISDFVDGVTVADWLSAKRPSPREAAGLCRDVAHALHHAHQQGIVHRDLKPSNIMLDQHGRPRVMDFGLAKRDAAEVTMTVQGQILGTPAYMSPEQARGDAHQADARSDIYSLGVILYELLTGEKPFRGTSQMLLHQVLKEEPPSPRKLNGNIPRDLETICLKCLEKEPDRRFTTADDVSAELQRFLNGEPICSRPISRVQRTWRWCQRNPVTAGLISAIAASLLIGLISTFWQWRHAEHNLKEATVAKRRETESRQAAETALSESESRLARVFVERGTQAIDSAPFDGLPWLIHAMQTEPEDSPLRKIHQLRIGLMIYELPKLAGYWSNVTTAEFSKDGSRLAVASGTEIQVIELSDFAKTTTIQVEQQVVGIHFTPQGDRIAATWWTKGRPKDSWATADQSLRIWDASTGKPTTESLDITDREYSSRPMPTVHFTPDGSRFTCISAGMVNRWHSKMVARVFNSVTLEQVSPTFAHHSDLDYTNGYHILSPDALRVLVPRGTTADYEGVEWNSDKFPKETNRPQQYDLLTAKEVHPPLEWKDYFYSNIDYSSSGVLIGASDKGKASIWDALSGELIKEFTLTDKDRSAKLQFHPDGETVFVIEKDRAKWLNIRSGDLLKEWKHEDKCFIDPTASYLIYRDPNGINYLSYLLTDEDKDSENLPDMYNVDFAPDGSTFVLIPAPFDVGGESKWLPPRIYRSADAKELSPPWRFSGRGVPQPFSKQGRFFMSRLNNNLWLWDFAQQKSIVHNFPPTRESGVTDAAFNADGSRLGVLTNTGDLTLYDAESGEALYPPIKVPLPPPDVDDRKNRWELITLNQSGKLIALAGTVPSHGNGNEFKDDMPVVQIWDVSQGVMTCDPIQFFDLSDSWLNSVHFLDNGKKLLANHYINRNNYKTKDVEDTSRIEIFYTDTGLRVREPIDFPKYITVSDVSRDQERCLVIHEARDPLGDMAADPPKPFAQLLDTTTWTSTTPRMIPDNEEVKNATLSPDGKYVVMGRGEVWNAVTGERLQKPLVSQDRIAQVVFEKNQPAFFTVSDQGGSGAYVDRLSELRRLSLDGKSLSPPMVNQKIDHAYCDIDPTSQVIAAAGSRLRFWDAQQGTMLSPLISLDVSRDVRSDQQHHLTRYTPLGNRIYLESDDFLMVVPWKEITAATPSEDALKAWASHLSGTHIDHAGGIVPLTADEFQQAWEVIKPHF